MAGKTAAETDCVIALYRRLRKVGEVMVCIGLYPHKCKECGKKFEARSEYAYKLHKYKTSDDFVWFCSYKCLRAYEDKHTRKKKPNERDQKVLDLIREGISLTEIGRRFGITYGMVAYIRDKWGGKSA